ncbi:MULTISPECIES: OpgC family protein [Methylobacterium]|uniref:OpgC domain-containing protein n=1 Tax=Methylobacterium longum TaxID=767694 RepID=A0ABT8AYS5_9HYPH|nr:MULTISPECIES: OpgC domain-containing protein [Methylobacterium]MCJ2097839.1 OpgC domain-containing protein [Methylobacterium sp. E-046]MDN3574954.1 OpgC domain-containing protein [Methylobacterium longum]
MTNIDALERPSDPGRLRPAPQSPPQDKPAKPVRDARVDVLRGFALLTIFVDHIPRNAPALFTLHNFGFSDAAEIFVLLAGYSSMMAYGGLFQRAGIRRTLGRIGRRCLRIYLFQAGLLLATLIIVRIWMDLTGLTPRFGVAPLIQMGLLPGLLRGLALNALPNYLDILPLYILLLALFPLIYFGLRRGVWGVLALSGTLWLAANLDHQLNLPNAAAVDDGWYFNPFAWQFLFVIGAALALAIRSGGGLLPRRGWAVATAGVYLAFALFQGGSWAEWSLPNLRPLAIDVPDKSHVGPLRLLDILALTYLLFSAPAVGRFCRHPSLRLIDACGRHSLEIFAAGCLAALIGRILYRTFDATWALQIAVNLGGIAVMLGLANLLDARLRRTAPKPAG